MQKTIEYNKWTEYKIFVASCNIDKNFPRLKACEISCKIWETRKIFPILHSAPCENNYTLREKCLYSKFFWYVFSLHSDWIRTRIIPNTDTFHAVTYYLASIIIKNSYNLNKHIFQSLANYLLFSNSIFFILFVDIKICNFFSLTGKKLSDWKGIGGNGHLTVLRIDTLQKVYGLGIRNNKYNSEAMSKATMIILIIIQKINRMTTAHPWKQVAAVFKGVATGRSFHKPIKNPLPNAVAEVMKPLFDRLGNK